ncbi:MAG: protein jag [Deltaproteobacteria bacterium]|nr:protein jag [Deltaproteobacteria bacterium]MBW1911780.1 protein jag [Deltaproteobacteria bacterium]
METFEFEGTTTEEAIQNASRQLNLPVEELDFDIIEPGSAGIFGLVGSRNTKIRVNVKGAETSVERSAETDAAGTETGAEAGAEIDNMLVAAKEALEKILALIPVDVTLTAEQSDGKIALNIDGDSSGILIGRKGKTLDALQYLVNRIVNKRFEKKTRIVVDSENYRQRRVESLTELALKMGDKAKKNRKSVTTNPLNPHDRRIVHMTLKDDKELDTRSRGEGLLKKVVILPRK